MESSGAPGVCTAERMPQKAAVSVEVAAAHFAGIRLTNGAADGIDTARARAASPVNGVPVNGVALGGNRKAADGGQQTERERCYSGIAALGKAPVTGFRKDGAGTVLYGAVLAYELVARKAVTTAYRAAVGVAVVTAVLLLSG